MKNRLVMILVVVLLLVAAASPAMAGGDQNRGDLAQGPAHQVQVQDPPPFQP